MSFIHKDTLEIPSWTVIFVFKILKNPKSNPIHFDLEIILSLNSVSPIPKKVCRRLLDYIVLTELHNYLKKAIR